MLLPCITAPVDYTSAMSSTGNVSLFGEHTGGVVYYGWAIMAKIINTVILIDIEITII